MGTDRSRKSKTRQDLTSLQRRREEKQMLMVMVMMVKVGHLPACLPACLLAYSVTHTTSTSLVLGPEHISTPYHTIPHHTHTIHTLLHCTKHTLRIRHAYIFSPLESSCFASIAIKYRIDINNTGGVQQSVCRYDKISIFTFSLYEIILDFSVLSSISLSIFLSCHTVHVLGRIWGMHYWNIIQIRSVQ